MKSHPWMPPLTREHGSWAIFAVPMIAGMVVADAFTMSSLVYGLASVGLFLAHHPLEVVAQRGSRERDRRIVLLLWGSGYAVFGATFAGILLAGGYWMLVPIAGLGALAVTARICVIRKRGKSVMSDWIGAVGLSLGAPAAYYVSTGRLDEAALLSWGVNVLFFGSTIFYVHQRIAAMKLKSAKLSMTQRVSLGKVNLLYHGGVIILVLGGAFSVGTPVAIVLALVPMALHAVWGTLRGRGAINLKRLGLTLIVQSLAFLVLLAVTGKEGIFP